MNPPMRGEVSVRRTLPSTGGLDLPMEARCLAASLSPYPSRSGLASASTWLMQDQACLASFRHASSADSRYSSRPTAYCWHELVAMHDHGRVHAYQYEAKRALASW